ncbi:MAG: MmgE/PrpD family protein [Anaerolineae bacterium]|nr:MmgE/PrpD family protein [Anaerolineae bacterium]
MSATSSQNTPNAVARIARYAANLTYDDLTDDVIIRARQIILDTIGTALGGYQTRLGKLAADFGAQMCPGDEASLIADGRRSTVEGAAWANGVMAKFLGMDDSHRTCGHVAAELVPVVLALGEQRQLSGKQLITALAVGYDVMDAIQPAVSKWQRERGLDHKGQAGTLASAVTAAVAMGLNEEKIAHALALAMDMASGTEQYVYDAGFCDTKDLLAGYAARNGMYAAKLADFGFQGPPGALDGPYGYFHAFGPGYDPAFLDNLGKKFALAETAFKPHAGCRQVHSCVDATQELLKAGRPNLDDITAIEVGIYHKAMTPSFRVNYAPETVGQAGFSLPVTVSVVLTHGSWYREDIEIYDAPEARRLRQLVKVYLDEAIEAAYPAKNGCVVRITTRDGQHYAGRVDYAKGEPENMLTEAEFAHKFRYLTGNLLPPERIDELMEKVSRLEQLNHVDELIRLTSPHLVTA